MPLSRLRRALPALALPFLPITTLPAGPIAPEGFEVRLVAAVPAVEYPCQVATAPDGSLFVAEDPMDQVGPYEAYDGRVLRFPDGAGEPTVFADGLRAIQGMAWRDGALYVSHMPFLTIVRDTNGDGKADTKRDLFKGLGPTDNRGLNDHIVSGIQFGMDGWLYISVGDKGVPGATRPEDGQKVQLKGGGTLRCRPDGTELEVYSTGTRNHLEANLDAADNLFTYDNTDDGDGWWTRVTHHIDGGYYGYPYDYHHHPERFLPRMAEYGFGSPCGAVFYRDDIWPEPYRGIGLWAEWGKGKVHAFRFEKDGASFKVAEPIDFVVPDDTANFRPIDLALSPDGRTLYIADWNMGGWASKTEKVGRVWAVTYTGNAETRPRGTNTDPIEVQIRQLDHPAYTERMRAQAAIVKQGRDALPVVTKALADPQTPALVRRHLLWALDAIAGGTPEAAMPTLALLECDVPDLRAQAARALGQRRVPIAVGALIKLLDDDDPTVRLQALIALGRIGDPNAVPALLPALAESDLFLAFSARQAIRRIGDWPAVADGLASDNPRVRVGTLLACEGIYEHQAASLLAVFARGDSNRPPEERAKALLALAEVHRKAKPWDGKWWGTRPSQGKPPAKTEAWEATPLVLETIRVALADPHVPLRAAAVAAVQGTGDRDSLPKLRERFTIEPDENIRRDIARALGKLEDSEALPLLVAAVREAKAPESVRQAALSAIETLGNSAATDALIDLLKSGDLAVDRLPGVMAVLGKLRVVEAVPVLLTNLESDAPAVRATAAEALGRIGRLDESAPALRAKLDDPEPSVRKAVVVALGRLRDREAVTQLVAAASRDETRFEATLALAAIPDTRAVHVFLWGLTDKNPDLRKASASALDAIRDEAAPLLERLAERKELPPSALPELVKVFTAVQPIRQWRVLGPFPHKAQPPIDPAGTIDLQATHPALEGKPASWRQARTIDKDGQIDLGQFFLNNDEVFAYGYAELTSPAGRKAQLAVGSDDTLTVWLNGRKVYDFADRRSYEPTKDRVDVTLNEGVNRLVIRCGNEGGGWQFSVAATTSADYAFLKGAPAGGFDPETYRQFAQDHPGDAAKGRALFADLKGLACIKCHVIQGEGGTVGPDLSGIGATYPRDDLIASVLYPSAKVFSGYEPVVLATADGRVLTGILKSDTPDAIEIQDAEAERIRVPRDQIEDRRTSDVSIMPSGLAEGLSPQDFADLIAYLTTLKDAAPKSAATR